MELRKAGATGLSLSRLGLGTMTWGRDTDEHEAADQARAFLEAGGNFIDTAAVYGNGDSEKVVGGLIGSLFKRNEMVIATKAGITIQDGIRTVNTSRNALLNELDNSLKRLGTDYVDLWQVHTWDDETPLDDTLTALDTAFQSGRARSQSSRRFIHLLHFRIPCANTEYDRVIPYPGVLPPALSPLDSCILSARLCLVIV